MSALARPRRTRRLAAAGAGLALVLALAGAARAERRCGWLDNPTPGNWWLTDADGVWILGTQGREPAPGVDLLPEPPAGEFVATNGPHGYFCACLDGDFSADPSGTRIVAATARPLSVCRTDRKLPRR